MTSLTPGLLTYVLVTGVLFGGPLHGPYLLFAESGRLGIPGWQGVTLAIIVAMGWLIYGPVNRYVYHPFRLSAFLAIAILIPTTCIVLISDWKRRQAIAAFGADYVEQNSLLTSLSRAPTDFQFYLHAAALKDCEPYGWSYRTMAFYPLSKKVAPNVIPGEWARMCGITIDR